MASKALPSSNIALFRGNEIRKTLHKKEWWFVISDVIAALTDSVQPAGYIKDMRRRDSELNQGWGQIATPLSVQTSGGAQSLNCANTEGIFRIIQSIPSPKAEPFKKWLAKVGYERIQEIEDPEIATKRTRALYKAKGYPGDWIEKRMRSIHIREELTNEWKNRGIQEDRDCAILTAEISKAAFGITPSEYKRVKGIKRENLRDHMNDLELIFSMLGEAATTEITRVRDTNGFMENQEAAREGGSVAGKARKELEGRTGKKIASPQNYLPETGKRRGLKRISKR
ncbi:MAG TPA: Bro-N domain-containing protein [Fibrobacteria bacterium]|nr:Bro-N domain-containing protein [Fibrobacteria bacterium]